MSTVTSTAAPSAGPAATRRLARAASLSVLWAWLLPCLLIGCEPVAPPPDLVGSSVDGQYVLSVRWEPRPLPFNEPFAALIELTRDGQPVTGATLGVSAWMPGHGHGMLRYPRVSELGAGRYRAEGLLFHMRGAWELRLDVVVDRLATRASLPVELP